MSSWVEKMRSDALAKRRLADTARRLSGLMHQPDVKKQFATQAATLEQLARDLDELVRQRSAGGEQPR
jgi:hypothetical protein